MKHYVCKSYFTISAPGEASKYYFTIVQIYKLNHQPQFLGIGEKYKQKFSHLQGLLITFVVNYVHRNCMPMYKEP